MKNQIVFVILLLVSITANSKQSSNSTPTFSDSVVKQNYRMEIIENSVKEIRRDQLNYALEKNLLKETFSSNFNTINLLITILLLFLTIIGSIFGYIGFKNIADLKRDYNKDLNELRSQKQSFTNRLNALISREKEFNKTMQEIIKTNKEQNSKIRLLELKDKVGLAYKQKNYSRAIDYIEIGLDEFPEDIELLFYMSFCYGEQSKYREANLTLEKLIKFGKKVNSEYLSNYYQNLAEYALLDKDFDLFESTFTHKEHFPEEFFAPYLNSLKYYIKQDKDHFIETIKEYVEKTENPILSEGWSFVDALRYIEKEPNTLNKLFCCFISFLSNKLSKEKMLIELGI